MSHSRRIRRSLVLGACLSTLWTVSISSALGALADDPPKKVEASLVLLTSMDITNAALGDEASPTRAAFYAWVKALIVNVETRFETSTSPQTVLVQVVLHPDRGADFAMGGNPAPGAAEIQELRTAVELEKSPRTRLTDCAFLVVAKVNGGTVEGDRIVPPASQILPAEVRLARFQAAKTPERLEILKTWAKSEVLPLIGAIHAQVDPKFEGVRKLATTLQAIKPQEPVDLVALTDRNPDYWRAMLEMAPGVPLGQTIRAFGHLANGEFDAARRLVHTFDPFDQRRSGLSVLLREFVALADVFTRDNNEAIHHGIELNDAGKFDEAIAAFDAVLKDYPRSAWAHYERYQSSLAKALAANQPPPEWGPTREAILHSDPLYGSMAEAKSANELFDLLLRKESEELFQDPEKRIADYARYAEITLDLNQPAISAMIDWCLLTSVKPERYDNRNLLEDFLYCLEQLGVKELKNNLKGNHASEFARIDAERAKRKAASPAGRLIAPKAQDSR